MRVRTTRKRVATTTSFSANLSLIIIPINITLDPRLPFPDSVGGIFPGPATTQKVYQGIEWFSQMTGLQWLTILSMLIRGITITLTGD